MVQVLFIKRFFKILTIHLFQEIEAEKKEMMSRISELEVELSSYLSGSKRNQVAENIEYIRLCRQFKQQTDNLSDAESANDILRDQIAQLKKQVEQLTESVLNNALNLHLFR